MQTPSFWRFYGNKNKKISIISCFQIDLNDHFANNLSKLAIWMEQPRLPLEATRQLAVVASAEEFIFVDIFFKLNLSIRIHETL
mgnify:CR=1 FL=1